MRLFRFILPSVYLVLVLLMTAVFISGAGGHGRNVFSFALYLMFPACLLVSLLPALPQDSGLVSALLCGLAGLLQWALVGYVIDKVIALRRRRKR